MIKNVKSLIALGVITITTAGSIVPANALCNTSTHKKHHPKRIVHLCINGKKHKLHIHPNCSIKPICPGLEDNNNTNPDSNTGSSDSSNNNTESDNNTSIPEDNINNSTNNDNNTTTPEDNTNNSVNNDNNTTTPEDNTNNSVTDDNNTTTPEDNTNNSVTDDNNTTTPEDNTNNSVNNSESNSNSFAAYQQEVVDLVNIERAKYGLNPLEANASLANVATMKSQDMIDKNYFNHTSPTYGSPFDMMKQFGITYRTAGENIAMGQKTPAEVVEAWMNSEGHRANILNANFKEIGIGVAKNANGQLYWTQMFIG